MATRFPRSVALVARALALSAVSAVSFSVLAQPPPSAFPRPSTGRGLAAASAVPAQAYAAPSPVSSAAASPDATLDPEATDRPRTARARRRADLDERAEDLGLDAEDIAVASAGTPAVARAAEPSIQPHRRGTAYVALQGFVAQHPNARAYGAMAIVQIPWDRVARPGAAVETTIVPTPASPRAARDEVESFVGTADRGDAAPLYVADRVSAVEPPASDEPWKAPVGKAGPEPADPGVVPADAIRRCVRAAWRSVGLGDNDQAVDGLSSRARASAWLPEMRLRGVRTDDASGRLTVTDLDSGRYVESGGATNLLEARMTWRFDRLVFAEEEVAIERVRLARAEARANVAHRVVGAVIDWEQANAVATDPAPAADERRRAFARRAQAETMLDAFTDGCWSAAIAGGAAKPQVP